MMVGVQVDRASRDQPGWYREQQLSSLWGGGCFILGLMDITFHLVPQSYYESLDPRVDYTPREFAREGFIHCTDGAVEMARTANRYYRSNPEPHYYLYIDKSRVRAPIRYDDAERIYPHIYGALNRDAIAAVGAARRDLDGTFLEPEPLPH
jgi:uncharacterized protein (DUF952 family)